MPKSRVRTKKPAAQRGIPADILAKAPGNLSAADRAAWCRHYLDGAAGRPYARTRQTLGFHWTQSAYRQGQNDRRPDAAGALGDMDTAKRRSDRRQGRAGDDLRRRISNLEGRLEAISGISPEMREVADDMLERAGLRIGLPFAGI